MFCRVVPYEGNEPYIFLSYCHKDQAKVYPIFEQMAFDGYRLWYDNGNHAGDDWLTKIEDSLERSKVVVAFFSEASSLSNNCKSEVTYAMKCGKKVLPILLGTDDLPKGMRMLLSYLHYLKAADYSSDRILLNKLYESEELQPCKGPGMQILPAVSKQKESSKSVTPVVPDISMVPDVVVPKKQPVEIPEEPVKEPKTAKKIVKVAVKKGKKEISSADTLHPDVASSSGQIIPAVKEPEPQKPVQPAAVVCEAKPESVVPAVPQKPVVKAEDPDVTVIGRGVKPAMCEPDVKTVYEGYRNAALLVQASAQKVTVLRLPQTKIGRSALNCDVVIEGNSSISKFHAEIIHTAQGWYLRDADSLNGTYLNGEKLVPGKQVKLDNPTVFQLDDEYLALITDELAWAMMDAKFVPLLVSESTSAVRVMDGDVLRLNRNNKWSDGTLADNTVHREAHARISRTGNGYQLLNESPHNTTCVNDTKMQQGDVIPLTSGDRIRLGDNTTLKFLMINIKGEG